MKKIGLLSDTHSYLDAQVWELFKEVDEIWHAGDIGDLKVLDELKKMKPVRAVFGNIDDSKARAELPEDLFFELEGFRILMTHIGGYPGHYSPRAKKIIDQYLPHIFICGHSHILKVMRDSAYQNMIVLNPGAAGIYGFHQVKTVLRFTLENGKMTHLEVVEMGKRGAILDEKSS